MPIHVPLCRAELPTAVHTEAGSAPPIRCSKREQCACYLGWLLTSGPAVDWACRGNTFDQFVPVQPVVKA